MAQTLGTMEFQWGKNIAGSTQSYESMLYNGIRYNLYDCAFIRSDLVEPHIGKLMRLYEEGGRPMIRVRWFFRAAELPSTMIKVLGQETLQEDPKELFIAQGNLKGVENENVVVICHTFVVLSLNLVQFFDSDSLLLSLQFLCSNSPPLLWFRKSSLEKQEFCAPPRFQRILHLLNLT